MIRQFSLAAMTAGALLSTAVAGSASAAIITFDFSVAGPYTSGGVTVTPSCAIQGGAGTCSVTQGAEGLGVHWTNGGASDGNGEIDGTVREETLSLTLTPSTALRLLSVVYETVDTTDDDDQASIIVNAILRGSGTLVDDLTNAFGITGATMDCGLAAPAGSNACLLDLNGVSTPANFTSTVFSFGDHSSADLDNDDDYRIRSVSFFVPDTQTRVPEPATLSLLGLGLLGLAGLRRRRR